VPITPPWYHAHPLEFARLVGSRVEPWEGKHFLIGFEFSMISELYQKGSCGFCRNSPYGCEDAEFFLTYRFTQLDDCWSGLQEASFLWNKVNALNENWLLPVVNNLGRWKLSKISLGNDQPCIDPEFGLDNYDNGSYVDGSASRWR